MFLLVAKATTMSIRQRPSCKQGRLGPNALEHDLTAGAYRREVTPAASAVFVVLGGLEEANRSSDNIGFQRVARPHNVGTKRKLPPAKLARPNVARQLRRVSTHPFHNSSIWQSCSLRAQSPCKLVLLACELYGHRCVDMHLRRCGMA